MLKDIKNIHFIGINGAGMTPLAIHSSRLGYKVSGSDLLSDNFPQLEKHGISLKQGHGDIPVGTDMVVYSAAVKETNSEYADAKKKNIPLLKRAEFIGLLTKDSGAILVSGSHGKSSTCVMLADIMYNSKFHTSALIGAKAISVDSNYFAGDVDNIILEADEYDRSFLKFYPNDLIILNIDDDHMDIYGDMEGLKDAFSELVSKLNEKSVLVYNGDCENVCDVISKIDINSYSFGSSEGCDYRLKNLYSDGFKSRMIFEIKGRETAEIEFSGTGEFNALNMLSVCAMVLEKGITIDSLKELVKKYQGLKRRQEVILKNDKYTLVDDYAHHPTEVEQSVSSIKSAISGRLIVMFQPHLFSRTLFHKEGFAESFKSADLIYISQIYPAREEPMEGVTSQLIYDEMASSEKIKTKVFDNFDELYESLKSEIKTGDTIVSMGAGEINKLLYKFKKELE